MKRRVVITGYGTINSVGNNVEETWKNLLDGKSGIDTIKSFDASAMASQIAGEVKNYDFEQLIDKRALKKMDRYTILAMVAAAEAWQTSGLNENNYNPERAGAIIGSGIGGIQTLAEEHSKLENKGPRRVSPFFIPKMISNIASAEVAIKYNLKGMNFNVVSACASANHAIGTAMRGIQYGDVDIMFAGGAEGAVSALSVAGFCSMKALSTRNDEPQKACRPFDKERDGFIMAEGAGVLVLEELEHAKARGANIIAELVGYGATCDAYHITAPAEGGEGGARAMAYAIKDAGITPEEVQYINAHGTSTPLNDKGETQLIKTVFGDHAAKLKINSTKSMVGHSLGAAAAIEAIVCCKTITDGVIHPTINLENPDPDCDLDYVPNKKEEHNVRIAVSNSLGFGGHNGVIVIKKYEE